ncbi:MAG: hypothetical protein FJ194_07130 [Gammaproteobacteria bacterium]|nr:hypothetical protein [Gammaproteobacteria bacterium]
MVVRAALVVAVLACTALVSAIVYASESQQTADHKAAAERDAQMGIETSFNFKRIDAKVTTSGVVGDKRLSALKAEGYDVVINLLPDNNEYAVPDEASIVTGQGLTYTYIPVEWSAPTRADFDAFEKAMDANRGKTIHVHCAANWRVSAFYGLFAERQGIWTREQADAHMRAIWKPDEHPSWTTLIREIRGE